MNGDTVQSRKQLIEHLFRLMDDFDSAGNHWENQDIHTFLQAMAAWLNDCEVFYHSAGKSIDVDQPSWQLFADMLSAAAVYE